MTYTEKGIEANSSSHHSTPSPSWLTDYLKDFFTDHSPSELNEVLSYLFRAFVMSDEFITLSPNQRANYLFSYERIRQLIDFTHTSVSTINNN